jgi:hypothetical protein
MSKLLSRLQLSREASCDELVEISDNPPDNIPLSGQRIIRDTYNRAASFTFFRPY